MNSEKNIGIVYYGQYPENRGIDQLAEGLRSIGCVPEIVAKPCDENFSAESVAEKVYYLQYSRWSKFTWAPVPLNMNWRRFITDAAKKGNWKAIVVRESPLAWAALTVGKNIGIPVFLDMRENLAAMYSSGNRSVLRKILRSRLTVWSNEKVHLNKFDHIFTVSSELGAWMQETYKIPFEKCSVLGNYPSNTFLEISDRAMLDVDKDSRGALKLIFSGYIRENRGLQDILEAICIVNSEREEHRVELKIIGDGDFKARLQDLCVKNEIDQYVEWLPMMSRENLLHELAKSDVGVCSYLLNEQTNQTLPGKMFEFMAMGLPILSSRRKPVVEIAGSANCGVFYDSRDPRHIASIIIGMLDDRKNLAKMGEEGKKAIIERFNQDTNTRTLQKVFRDYSLCD